MAVTRQIEYKGKKHNIKLVSRKQLLKDEGTIDATHVVVNWCTVPRGVPPRVVAREMVALTGLSCNCWIDCCGCWFRQQYHTHVNSRKVCIVNQYIKNY